MTREAVHVGINAYRSSPLRGCVNDAHDWNSVAEAGGYTRRTLLLDAAATKAAILDAIDQAAHRLRSGDRFMLTYSGHGSWGPDRSGDEADRRDECLVPVDYQRAGMLWDDELHEALVSFRRGVRRLVASDSCHSGTVTRSLTSRRTDPTAVPRYLPPAEWIGDARTLEDAVRVEGTRPVGTPRTGAVLLSGCTDLEYSYDAQIGGRPRGAFTAAAIEALHVDRPRTVNAWHKGIRRRLPTEQYPQTPEVVATTWQRYGYAPL